MTDKEIDISDAPTSREKGPEEPPRFITVGGLVDRTRVSLCIYGDDLIPEAISEILRVTPSHAHRKGDLIQSPASDVVGTRRTGAWILKLSGKALQEPEELTTALLDLLPKDETIWAELASRAEIVLSYGLFLEAWNRGFSLPPELVARIARMRAMMNFDIYADLEDEDG